MRSKHDRKGLLKRLGVVIGVVVIFIALGQVIDHAAQPQIQYKLKKADCSNSAITARNEALGADLKSCVLIITAKNLQNRSVYVDYDGVGGGPAGGGNPLIKIYSANQKFCYAPLAGNGASFKSKAANELTLRCGLVQNPPGNYDEASDTNPTSIEVGGYSKTTIKVEPAR